MIDGSVLLWLMTTYGMLWSSLRQVGDMAGRSLAHTGEGSRNVIQCVRSAVAASPSSPASPVAHVRPVTDETRDISHIGGVEVVHARRNPPASSLSPEFLDGLNWAYATGCTPQIKDIGTREVARIYRGEAIDIQNLVPYTLGVYIRPFRQAVNVRYLEPQPPLHTQSRQLYLGRSRSCAVKEGNHHPLQGPVFKAHLRGRLRHHQPSTFTIYQIHRFLGLRFQRLGLGRQAPVVAIATTVRIRR
ncbi:hypothetical protein VTK56DRAFT_4114 [Thermocarpiscus australiensis]